MALTYQLGCLLACLQCFWGPTGGGKLLVIPTDGSHWLSMQILLKELHGRGHKVMVVYPENNLLITPSSNYSSKTFSIAFSKAEVNELYENVTEMGFYSGTFYQRVHKTLQHVNKISQFLHSICKHLLFNTELMKELAEEKYDALLTDPSVPCGTIIAENLSLPTINLLRWLPCGLDNLAMQCPRPLSYVPRILSGNTDRMTFLQRMKNVLLSLLEPLLCWFIYSPFEELAQRFLQRDVTLVQLLSQTSIWLLRYDFTLEYPRPLMPNMVLVGGINCKDRKPLPQDLEEFMNSSGEHGAVIFSLGSMMSGMPIATANLVAEALGQIPQKVLWRYVGEKPSTLASNTKLMKWLPQNDLLGHPKMRAFLTHGGSHGVYEAICSAVPMVLLPLFSDQADNAERIKDRGAGIVLSLKDTSSRDLRDALSLVINDSRYKEAIMKMSSIYKDRSMESLELSAYWVEYVMRHGGAKHLRPAAHDYNWIQYHCLDVMAALVAMVLLLLFLVIKCCLFCRRRVRGQAKRKKD
ncbi:UDP-glucuronosyltransferase 1A1-like [Carcharodon carcharias]|uniref:UDP-glucuronosyltransferase 1A1-like n=1 Tax=Carcharodon carcharias TaxID=13397 RepID=UPI001B7E8A1A|nr:UDP-glucuronosyltransferase 1A1-like [Carcharodon carcharias]